MAYQPRSLCIIWACALQLILWGICCPARAANSEPREWVKRPSLEARDFASNTITALVRDEQDTLWVGTDVILLHSTDLGRNWGTVNLGDAKLLHVSKNSASASYTRPTGAALQRRNSITCLSPGSKGMWVGTMNGLCRSDRESAAAKAWFLLRPTKEELGLEDRKGLKHSIGEPRIWAVTEHRGKVWVSAEYRVTVRKGAGLRITEEVNVRNFMLRSTNWGQTWNRIPGNFPQPVRQFYVGRDAKSLFCVMAGFDTARRHGGGQDMLLSRDDGQTWDAQITRTASRRSGNVSTRTHKIARLGSTLWACTRYGLAKGNTASGIWSPVHPSSGLEARQVYDVVRDGSRMWAATDEGLFHSRDFGKTWKRELRYRGPIYHLLYHKGYLWAGTSGGLLRRNRDGNWIAHSRRGEVNAIVLAHNRGSRARLWVGSQGGLSYSRNGGKTWRFLSVADGLPSNAVLCLAMQRERLWVGTDGGVWTTLGLSESGTRYGRRSGLRGYAIRDLVVEEDTLWAATNHGLSVFNKGSREWETKARRLNAYAVAVEGRAVFAAVLQDDGTWAVVRMNPKTETTERMRLPGHKGERIHSLKKTSGIIWCATDVGLYSSRDGGASWARYGTESLWARRVTRLALGPNNVLCAQSMPVDPPGPSAFLNLSRNDGQSWTVVPTAVPGHGNAIVLGNGIAFVGTRDGLSTYLGYEEDSRPVREGWVTWRRMAAKAASGSRKDRLGFASAVDPYAPHRPTYWLASNGTGALERGDPILDARHPIWNANGTPISDLRELPTTHLYAQKRIFAIHATPDHLWFGVAKGLFSLDRSGRLRQHLPGKYRLAGAPVRALTSRGKRVWIGTDQGLSIYSTDTKQWVTYRRGEAKLPDEHITALACDGVNIWGGTPKGGFRIDEKGRWKQVLIDEPIYDIAISSARQYFSTSRGILALDRDGRVRKQIEKGTVSDKIFVEGPELWGATRYGVRRMLFDRAEPRAQITTRPSLRGPEGVLVIINEQSKDSITVGEGYAALRGIPKENLVRINCPDQETIKRRIYNRQIRNPIRQAMRERKLSRKISFIVTTRGVPLRIASESHLSVRAAADRREASVDSELTLLQRSYSPKGWISNPFLHHYGYFDSTRYSMYLVTRLDGPTADIAIGMVRSAINEEKRRSLGSRGFVRFDMYPSDKEIGKVFNSSIEANYARVRRQSRLSGRIGKPERSELPFYKEGDCFNTFFYLGWGAGEYKPGVFSWIQGAIGINLDPKTATTLRDPKGAWLAGAINHRLTASIGMVYDGGPEPYLSVTGLYGYLMAKDTWAEAAYKSLPHLSWQGVVIGDPLYRPF
jgi:uncharacterized protein (TIGR03790 family)